MRRVDNDSTALLISSITFARSSPDAPSRAWPTRPWPRLASARRSSGWKSTTRAMTQNDQKLTSSHSVRSEEHTSELQSLAYLVCRLLLEKKKKPTHQ